MLPAHLDHADPGGPADSTLNTCAGVNGWPSPTVCPRCLGQLIRRAGSTSECPRCGLLLADLDLAALAPAAAPSMAPEVRGLLSILVAVAGLLAVAWLVLEAARVSP